MANFLIPKRYSFPPHRFPSLASIHVHRFYHSLDGAEISTDLYSDFVVEENAGQFADTSKWRTINAGLLGIKGSMIPSPAWTVLRILRIRGFEAYLVGGCVRDLLLNREPKDYDVITNAKLAQVKNEFHRCHIIGQRFPICRVLIQGVPVEVSSFETVGRHAEEKEKVLFSKMPNGFDEKDFIRWRDSMHRDFTINSLFYDPFKHKIYDYTNGMADLKTLELRTIIPAQLSFQEDCARILRGLRIAGRLGLSITKDTEAAMHELSSSVSSLGKFRMMMEMNYMLSYGAAESTISLLQRFCLLEKFLPFHAAYLDQQAHEKSASSCMMMKLFSSLDRLFSCDRPCTCTVWIALLAFHQALVINPQDGLVLWAFASILYHGDWRKGIEFARENAKAQVVPEISGCYKCKSDEELAKEVARLAYLLQESVAALIDGESLSKYMFKYPASPNSSSVFIPERTGNKVVELFDELVNDIKSFQNGREHFEISYHLLNSGDKHETRFAMGKVVLETLREEVPKGLGLGVSKKQVIQEKGYRLLKEEQKDIEDKEYKVQKEELEITKEKAYPVFSHFIKRLVMVKDGMLETLSKGVFQGQKVLKGEQEVIEEKEYPAVPHFIEHLVVSTKAKGSRKPVEVVKEDLGIVKEGWKSADFSVPKQQGLVEDRQHSPLSGLEPKQDQFKKEELLDTEGCSMQDAILKKSALILNSGLQEIADKKLAFTEKDLSMGQDSLSEKIKLLKEKQHLPQRQISQKGNLAAIIQKHPCWASEPTTRLEVVKHLKLHNQNAKGKANILESVSSKYDKILQENKKDHPPLSHEVVPGKSKKFKEVWSKESNDLKHQSLFKEDKMEKHQDQDKKCNKKVKVKHLKLHDEKTEDNATVLENNSSNDVKIKQVEKLEKTDHSPVPQEVARNKSKKIKERWSTDSNAMKHQDLVKENGKHSLLSVMKSKQDKFTQKKLVKIESYSKEHRSEVRENKPELLDMIKFPREELNERQGNSSEIKLPRGRQHLPQLTVSGEGHLTVKSEKQQYRTKKPTNKVQKAKHKMHDKESVRKAARVGKDLTKKEKIKLEDEKDLPLSSQDVVRIGIKKVRETVILEKGYQPGGREESLCNEVFSEKSEHFQAAFSKEKMVQPSLSELFRR